MQTGLAFWFFVLGLPLAAFGALTVARVQLAAGALKAFPRNVVAGRVLCAVGWFWTAHELDVIGISFFDSFLKVFPGELWLLAAVLTFLTCWWMENLLPIRGASAVLMLFPASLFPAVRLCATEWRLALVAFAYLCAIVGMFSMFYPWHARRAIDWLVGRPSRVFAFGAALSAVGALFLVLGTLAATGAIS